MQPISVEEAERRLPELLKRAAGERVFINDRDSKLVKIVAAGPGPELTARPRQSRLWDLRKGLSLGDVSVKQLVEEGRE